MRSIPILGLGIGFILMGAALYALTLRASKPASATPKKSELREQEMLREEKKKMRIGAVVVAAFGVVLLLIS